MRSVLFLGLVVLAAVGCTARNPRSCSDGICTDPAFPFCDVDGAFGENVETCVAVDCAPGEVAACRSDQAIRCNATGTDFDLVQCELGCDAATGGCKGCSSDEQCNNPSPVCETTTNTCRTCVVDDECASRVCDIDTGRCLAETEVVYAAPTGADAGPCSLAMPCSLTEASAVASANLPRSTVRLLPGVYGTPLVITGSTITLIGVGATHQVAPGTKSLDVGDNAHLTVRGLTFELPPGGNLPEGILCNGTPNTPSVSLRGLAIRSSQSIRFASCALTMRDVSVQLASGNFNVETLDADRVRFQGTATPRNLTGGKNIRIVNSLFDNMAFTFGGGSLSFAFNTVFINGTFSPVVTCNSTGTTSALIENNVLLKIGSQGVQDALQTQGTICTANRNVLSPQITTIPGNNVVMDPLLLDPVNHDFHLQNVSPAIDSALPSTGLEVSADFERVARPQGLGFDIGAFERTP